MFNGKVSVREASEMLDLTPKYLRSLAEQGKIPHYTFREDGRKLYFDIEDLEKLFIKYMSVDEILNSRSDASGN